MKHLNKSGSEIITRPITISEIKKMKYGDQFKTVLNSGRLGNVRVASSVKTWKRNPNRLEVSFKYGLYESVRMETQEMLERILVEI